MATPRVGHPPPPPLLMVTDSDSDGGGRDDETMMGDIASPAFEYRMGLAQGIQIGMDPSMHQHSLMFLGSKRMRGVNSARQLGAPSVDNQSKRLHSGSITPSPGHRRSQAPALAPLPCLAPGRRGGSARDGNRLHDSLLPSEDTEDEFD